MKYNFTLIFIFSAFLMHAQIGINWSDEIPISESGNSSPVVRVLEDGTPVIIFGESGDIYFTKRVNNQFTEPRVLQTASTVDPFIYGFAGIDMATFGNEIFIVMENWTTGTHVIHSTNGGDTFSDPVNLFDPEQGKWTIFPSIDVDDQGNPVVSVLYENIDETEAVYYVISSDDGGISYNSPVIANELADGQYVCECCPSDLYVDGDITYLIFRNNNNNQRDTWIAKSDNNNLSFDVSTDIDETDWMLNACPVSSPNISSMLGDSLIGVWMSGAFGPTRIYCNSIDQNSMEIGSLIEMPLSGSGVQRNPDVAGGDGNVCVVWDESGIPDTNRDIIFAFSHEGSANLTYNLTNLTQKMGVQRSPSIAYNNEVFHLVYKDESGLVYREGMVGEISSLPFADLDESKIRIVQNPAIGNKIEIAFDESLTYSNYRIQLLDLSSQLVHEWSSQMMQESNKLSLSISGVPFGVYILNIESGDWAWSQKVIIE